MRWSEAPWMRGHVQSHMPWKHTEEKPTPEKPVTSTPTPFHKAKNSSCGLQPSSTRGLWSSGMIYVLQCLLRVGISKFYRRYRVRTAASPSWQHLCSPHQNYGECFTLTPNHMFIFRRIVVSLYAWHHLLPGEEAIRSRPGFNSRRDRRVGRE